MCSLKNWTPMFMSSTASRAERPFSGAPAAWGGNSGELILALDTGVAGSGCDLVHISRMPGEPHHTPANTPSLAMNAFVAAPSSPGQP